MNWSAPIDLYCERTDASFWAEPANALSNAAFLIAAAAAFWLWRRAPGRDWPALALIIVVMAVGDRKSTRLNSSHVRISDAVFCLKKKKTYRNSTPRAPLRGCIQFRCPPHLEI